MNDGYPLDRGYVADGGHPPDDGYFEYIRLIVDIPKMAIQPDDEYLADIPRMTDIMRCQISLE